MRRKWWVCWPRCERFEPRSKKPKKPLCMVMLPIRRKGGSPIMVMVISRMNHQRTWDTDERELQSFLGLALWDLEKSKPKFGAGLTAPLRKRGIETLRGLAFDKEKQEIVGEDEDELVEMLLTNLRLAWHFGHMDWAMEN